MNVNITKQQELAKLKEVADNYENMIGVEITEEDANESLDEAAQEIVEGILNCLFREIK